MGNIRYTTDDILNAKAFCNPVNLVGVMGKGLAAEVARRWPACVGAYRGALRTRALREGSVTAWKRPDGGWILQVPTKRHWRDRSPLELVKASIEGIGRVCTRHGIATVAVPPLGCGLGGLEPSLVQPLVLEAAAAYPEIEWTLHRWPQPSPGQTATGTDPSRGSVRPRCATASTRRPSPNQHYEATRQVFKKRWPDLGEGRNGFRPPF